MSRSSLTPDILCSAIHLFQVFDTEELFFKTLADLTSHLLISFGTSAGWVMVYRGLFDSTATRRVNQAGRGSDPGRWSGRGRVGLAAAYFFALFVVQLGGGF